MEAGNDITNDCDGDDGGIAGYEQLRRRALGGDSDGWRLGLAVLQQRGVAAWLQVQQLTADILAIHSEDIKGALHIARQGWVLIELSNSF